MIRAFLVLGSFVFPTAVCAAPIDDALTSLEAELTRPLASVDCAPTLLGWRQGFEALTGASPEPALLKRQFDLRGQLRERLRAWAKEPAFRGGGNAACVAEVRLTLSALRGAEEEIAIALHVPMTTAPNMTGDRAWLTTANGGPVTLRSGDVLVSHGTEYVSAAIAKIGSVEGDFSHAATVYIDAPPGTEISATEALSDPRVRVIESWIQIGAFEHSFGDYAETANSRIAQFRPRQSAARAHHAAWAVHDWVLRWQLGHAAAYRRKTPNVDDNPPYDFHMDMTDASQVFCTELVRIGQASVGWQLPMFQSALKRNAFTEAMGVRTPATFAPSDFDVDPRFDLRAEWRNLDVLELAVQKDATLSLMYASMARGQLKVQPNAEEVFKAHLIWAIRQADLGFTTQMVKNITPEIIAMMFALNRVATDVTLKAPGVKP